MVNTAMARVTFWGEQSEVRAHSLPSLPPFPPSPCQTPPHFLKVHGHGLELRACLVSFFLSWTLNQRGQISH